MKPKIYVTQLSEFIDSRNLYASKEDYVDARTAYMIAVSSVRLASNIELRKTAEAFARGIAAETAFTWSEALNLFVEPAALAAGLVSPDFDVVVIPDNETLKKTIEQVQS